MVELTAIVSLAKALHGPVGRLNALVVPLSQGGRDSHGHASLSADEAHKALRQSIDEAAKALAGARLLLDEHT